jgi:hypothetical protein
MPKDIPSLHQIDIKNDSLLSGFAMLKVLAIDSKQAIPNVNVTITGANLDTTIITGLAGQTSFKSKPNIVKVAIFHDGYNSVQIDTVELNANTITRITAILGSHLMTNPVRLYSKRKLSEKEIKEITDDLNNDKHENEIKLIKDKTCYLLNEI